MGLKLGDFSPLAGMLTGEGLTGNLISQGVGGMIPAMIAREAQKGNKEEEEQRKREEEEQRVVQAMRQRIAAAQEESSQMKKGGRVKKYAKGGAVSASRRGDGCAQRGKTKGRMI